MVHKDNSNNKQTCTCRKCTGGWLSPRMRYRLKCEADIEFDMMQMTLESPLKSELERAPGVEYLPGLIQERGIKEATYAGYTTIVGAILAILEMHGEAGVPSVDNVSAAIAGSPDGTAGFFAEGGTVKNALEFIVYAAMDSSPLGDGTWDAGRAAEAKENEGSDEYWNLPLCANDLDWGLVAEKLGISASRYDTAVANANGTAVKSKGDD
ncbi:hypothetical protein C8Q80DRAFT_785713 [Daedaleopsis nitida]|nr:hypothetical protein C8Q80DRAFT_785713 [Daedaleopsis nitida]